MNEELSRKDSADHVGQDALYTGLMLGIAGISITIFLYFLDANLLIKSNWLIGAASVLISVGICAFLGRKWSKKVPHTTFSKGYTYGLIAFTLAGVIQSVWKVVLFHLIDPVLVEKSLDMIRKELESEDLDAEAMESALSISEKFVDSPWIMLSTGVFSSVIFAAIIALFIGFILRKKSVSPTQ